MGDRSDPCSLLMPIAVCLRFNHKIDKQMYKVQNAIEEFKFHCEFEKNLSTKTLKAYGKRSKERIIKVCIKETKFVLKEHNDLFVKKRNGGDWVVSYLNTYKFQTKVNNNQNRPWSPAYGNYST